MATYLPIPGGLAVYAKRYVSDDIAFALGFNYWFGTSITVCVEVTAVTIIMTYWTEAVPAAAWITIVLLSLVALNIFSVKGYGEAEFIFASIKIIAIVGLLILSFIIDLGGGPSGHRLGFQYWNNPGAMRTYLKDGDVGRFLGVLATFVYAAFAFTGCENIAVTAGEAENPRRNIPKACNRVIYRILLFYIGGVLAIGVTVAYNDKDLAAAIKSGSPGAAASPFVVAIENAGISVLPSVINAVILTSAWSAGNAFLYTASRNLYALALNGNAPRVFARCNRNGVPYVAVLGTTAVALLTYLNVSNSSAKVFGWFANLTTVCALFNWTTLSFAYIRFRKGALQQGIYHTMPKKAWFSPYSAYWAFGSCIFIITIQGFTVFFDFKGADFVAAYVGVLIYLVPFASYKIIKRSKMVPYAEMDFFTGKAEVDEHQKSYVEQEPRNWLERFWFWLA